MTFWEIKRSLGDEEEVLEVDCEKEEGGGMKISASSSSSEKASNFMNKESKLVVSFIKKKGGKKLRNPLGDEVGIVHGTRRIEDSVLMFTVF
jgi:hypothetical protein